MSGSRDAADGRIRLRRIRQNNLRGFDLDIPLDALTIVTGVSGSGKSSLAFDTLYAEGQRRYVASFSGYARQFLERLPAPDVEEISGSPPAVSLRAVRPPRSARSTVGTVTEILDHLQILYARAATLVCEGCGREVTVRTPATMARDLIAEHEGARARLAFELDVPESLPDDVIIGGLVRAGFLRILIDGREARVDRPPTGGQETLSGRSVEVITDRLALVPRSRRRLVEAIETALVKGHGQAVAHLEGETVPLVAGLACACGRRYTDPSPGLFSFNNALGACAACKGFGRIITIDRRKVVPDPSRTLLQGAVKPLTTPRFRSEFRSMISWCRKRRIPVDRPWSRLSLRQQEAVWSGGNGFCGIQGLFDWLESKTYKMHVRIQLARYRGYETCPTCRGTRLVEDVQRYRLGALTLPELCALPVARAHAHVAALSATLDEAVRPVLERVESRLSYLNDVGLGYLSLDRPARTLSGGEAQRVHMTAALGASLVSTLFVIDEPSAGLHASDSGRLVRVLRRLCSAPNTVVVVEHDPEIIRAADHLVDLGPGAGEDGGRLLFSGPPERLPGVRASATARYLTGKEHARIPPERRAPDCGHRIEVRGARAHNLQGLDLDVPLGLLVAVTGVSGSGKSTLVDEIIHAHLATHFGEMIEEIGACDSIAVHGPLDGIVRVDQGPPGRSSRSNPATYCGAWDGIRKLYGKQASDKGLEGGARLFSFNVPGGRCEICKGEGAEQVDMQFLADVRLTCGACGGKQFSERVLTVTWRGRSIHDVLQATVDEALDLFAPHPTIVTRLEVLSRVGLGYLRLGQPTTTLSGGEAQRLKLARHLAEPAGGSRLFVLDEPTVGLHLADVARLVAVLQELVEAGQSILVVEHHLDLVAAADQVIDLGPGGGPEGGRLVASGTPEAIAACAQSITGRHLREILARSPRRETREKTAAREDGS